MENLRYSLIVAAAFLQLLLGLPWFIAPYLLDPLHEVFYALHLSPTQALYLGARPTDWAKDCFTVEAEQENEVSEIYSTYPECHFPRAKWADAPLDLAVSNLLRYDDEPGADSPSDLNAPDVPDEGDEEPDEIDENIDRMAPYFCGKAPGADITIRRLRLFYPYPNELPEARDEVVDEYSCGGLR